ASARARVLTHWLLSLDPGHPNALHGDELTIEALREVLSPERTAGRADATKVVDRAKQYLHAHGHERLGLREIAQQIGVSSVYLTQEFTRSEGMPLYRYQMRLRMSRALVELPHCDDITGLAIDLGFSSHSHFSATFKAVFGATPSDIRAGGQPH
ncbi:MAG: helix-turn-helix transcriptional regulator, partial [Gammaproteobacteria bacterium]